MFPFIFKNLLFCVVVFRLDNSSFNLKQSSTQGTYIKLRLTAVSIRIFLIEKLKVF